MRQFEFNPERVARYEASGWRAYYDQDWFRLFQIVHALCQEEFHIPFPLSLVAAYHSIQASEAWAPIYHDTEEVRRQLERFYRLARRYSGLTFDPGQVAELELKTWVAHRELSGKPDKRRLISSMIELHSALFGLDPRQARESAQYRVLANTTVDLITNRTSSDPEADWAKLREYLRRAYVSISEELAFAPKGQGSRTSNQSAPPRSA
jgi:hypothetical protein